MIKTGIYKITNNITQESYIGQSRDIEKRWRKHCNVINNLKDHSYEKPLYRAFRKYGIENFSFEIIEECLVEELNQKEIYWIKYYDTFFNGYNLTMGGDGSGVEINKNKVIGIIKDLETCDDPQRVIAERWGLSEEMVQGINTGRYWRYDREYPIRKNPFEKKENRCIDCGKLIYRTSIRCKECDNIHRRNDPSKNHNITREELKKLIRTTPFTKIGEKYGVTDNAVRKWCDKWNLPRKVSDIKKYSDEEWEKI